MAIWESRQCARADTILDAYIDHAFVGFASIDFADNKFTCSDTWFPWPSGDDASLQLATLCFSHETPMAVVRSADGPSAGDCTHHLGPCWTRPRRLPCCSRPLPCCSGFARRNDNGYTRGEPSTLMRYVPLAAAPRRRALLSLVSPRNKNG